MKNIPIIKVRLTKFRDSNKINEILNTLPAEVVLDNKLKKILSDSAIVFINKLLKHLDSKRPSKSSITNLIYMCVNKLQHKGIAQNGLNCFLVIVTEIINSTFQDAFSTRLNVKSKEFLDLEDCEPF